jgi:hypothetical protein
VLHRSDTWRKFRVGLFTMLWDRYSLAALR